MDSNYIRGCRTCFCNGLEVACRSSDLYYNRVRSRFQDSGEGWKIRNTNELIPSANLKISAPGTLEFSNVQSFPGQDLYFVAPAEFTGNKVRISLT